MPSLPRGIGGNSSGAGHFYTIVFPLAIVKFLLPLFPDYAFILSPGSKGAEKLLFVFLFLSGAFGKSVFQKGESIRQMKTISALQNNHLTRACPVGWNCNNLQFLPSLCSLRNSLQVTIFQFTSSTRLNLAIWFEWLPALQKCPPF